MKISASCRGSWRQGLGALSLLAMAWGLFACGGSSHSTSTQQTITSTGTNVAAISVNSGVPGIGYVDGAFASVTVCVPGTSTCQTVPDVLVDTGSSGLRLLSSALTIALPQQQSSGGNPIAECLPFVSSYTWGQVETADVELGGEKASSAPIQVIGTTYSVPTQCSDLGPGAETLETLGTNGILGVGLFPQDCGTYCETVQSSSVNLYYQCSSSTSCQPVGESLAQQVVNPVTLFTTDNNGVIIELPSVPDGAASSVSGSLVFGIGTESNNQLGTATVYTADSSSGNFSTNFQSSTFTGTSFIDSGSNGYFFPSSITQCPSNVAPGFYCPSSTENLSATTVGTNNASTTINFSIANAENLFNSNNAAFSDLGGTYSSSPAGFDWGLPFFFGRNVFVAIEGQNVPSGPAPYWAY